MRRASRTSSLVTLLRALAHGGVTEVDGFADPTALRLLPPGWRALARVALAGNKRLFLAVSQGQGDLVALRTRVLDEAWGEAHRLGARQLVLLGAGLDGRAYRLETLSDCAVFEVDHPGTQALKRARAEGLVERARRHVFVPVDFEKDGLQDALGAAGFLASQRAFFIWEGVTPYLTEAAQQATLAAVAELSAPGSRLAMTYIEPGLKNAGVQGLVSALGEPFLGLMPRALAAERLAQAGLRVIEDSGIDEWRRRFARRQRAALGLTERIALAER